MPSQKYGTLHATPSRLCPLWLTAVWAANDGPCCPPTRTQIEYVANDNSGDVCAALAATVVENMAADPAWRAQLQRMLEGLDQVCEPQFVCAACLPGPASVDGGQAL